MNKQEFQLKLMRWRWPSLGGILLLVAAGYWLGPMWLGPSLPAFPVVRSQLIQTVVASGRVESPSRIDIGSQITGEVSAVPVAEGQEVKAGQPLIQLENSDEAAAVAQEPSWRG